MSENVRIVKSCEDVKIKYLLSTNRYTFFAQIRSISIFTSQMRDLENEKVTSHFLVGSPSILATSEEKILTSEFWMRSFLATTDGFLKNTATQEHYFEI